MKILINLTAVVIVVTSASGCSRFRQMTRRDYDSMQDPFATRLADADTTTPEPPAEAKPSVTGFASLDSTEQSTAVSRGEAPNGSADRGRIPRSQFASHAREVPASSMSSAMTGADSYSEQTDDGISGVATVAAEVDSGFADWAAQQQQEWDSQVGEVENAVGSAVVHSMRQVSAAEESVAEVLQTGAETAEPLIRTADVSGAASAGLSGSDFVRSALAPRPEKAFGPAPVFDDVVDSPVEANTPFQNPSAGSDHSKLDAGFEMDTGWRPSSLETR